MYHLRILLNAFVLSIFFPGDLFNSNLFYMFYSVFRSISILHPVKNRQGMVYYRRIQRERRYSMKKAMQKVLFISLLFLAMYMATHRPSEEQFYMWLEEEYQINCKEKVSCTKKTDGDSVHTLIETGSTIKKGYLLFNTVGKSYEDQNGGEFMIKAIGVLGHYYIIIDETSSNS
jgi:hypothetical protein